MKRSILPACALALPFVVASAFAADAPVMDETSRMNYALGYQIGRDLAGTEFKADALVKGLDDGSKGAAPALKPEEMEAALTLLLRLRQGGVAAVVLCPGSRSAPLVEAVIQLAHTLGLEVVAEGIEETATERFLADRGCDVGQGFLFAPAMPAHLFIDYARSAMAREPQRPAAG